MPISDNRAKYLTDQFRFKLTSRHLKTSASGKLSSDDQKKNYEIVTELIRAIIIENQQDFDNITDRVALIYKLLDAVWFFNGMLAEQKELLATNLAYETELLPLEAHNFVHLPKDAFSDWFASCMEHQWKMNEGKFLLSLLIGNTLFPERLNQSKLQRVSGFTHPTLRKYLDFFQKQKFLSIDHAKHYGIITPLPKHWKSENAPILGFSPDRIQQALFGKAEILSEFAEIGYIGYCYVHPIHSKNPFVAFTGQTIVIHETLCQPELMILTLLSKNELLAWLKQSITKPHQVIKQLVNRGREFTGSRIIPDLAIEDPHFSQIKRIFPVLRYMGTRELKFDISRALYLTEYWRWTQETGKRWLLTMLRGESSAYSPGDLDYEYFVDCLCQPKPGESWRKKYPDRPIHLVFSNLADTHILEGRFDFFELSGDWDRETLRANLPKLVDRDWIENLLASSPAISQLNRFTKEFKDTGKISLSFQPSILEHTTHSLFFRKTSPQTIPKSIRSIITAREKFQLVWIDVKQMHLQVLLGLSRKYYPSINTSDDTENFFQVVAQKLGSSREAVKTGFYAKMNGAGESAIMRKCGFGEKEYAEFSEALHALPGFSELSQKTDEHARKTGTTLPTPLGFRIPLYNKSRLALGYLVQATANEIFRQWILELTEVKCASYLVNAIHDELFFELPIAMNLYQFAAKVDLALKQACERILPTCNLPIKVKAAKNWDTDAAVMIDLHSLSPES